MMDRAISRRSTWLERCGLGGSGSKRLRLTLCLVGICLAALTCLAIAAWIARSLLNWAV